MITADLLGKVAFATGGASGIGLAAVERLVANKVRVAVNIGGVLDRLARLCCSIQL